MTLTTSIKVTTTGNSMTCNLSQSHAFVGAADAGNALEKLHVHLQGDDPAGPSRNAAIEGVLPILLISGQAIPCRSKIRCTEDTGTPSS
jgi:hypothetical protein